MLDLTLSARDQAMNDVARVLQPPAQVERFPARPGDGPAQWASYSVHPAYATISSTLLEKMKAFAIFAHYFCVVLTKRLISYELIPAHVRTKGGSAFAVAALSNIARRARRHATTATSQLPEPILASLTSNGVCVVELPNDQFRTLSVVAQPLFEQLRRRRGASPGGAREFEESRDTVLRTANSGPFDAVEGILARNGVLDAVSAYLGRPARLIDVNPQINDASDDFWQRIFTDLPDADRPARYFHKDASGGDVKAIFYMSDVGPKSGPFSYAIGSHNVTHSAFANWVEESNDQSGLSGTDRLARQRFMALPAPLRRKCAVGNDLLPDDEAAQRLLRAEWIITAGRGHLVLFDTKGLHRGGMVADGERAVITCVLG